MSEIDVPHSICAAAEPRLRRCGMARFFYQAESARSLKLRNPSPAVETLL